LLPDVEDIAAGDEACPGNAVRQAGRLIPCGNREPDRMAAYALRSEIGGILRALAA
jgi:hypothetical protein